MRGYRAASRTLCISSRVLVLLINDNIATSSRPSPIPTSVEKLRYHVLGNYVVECDASFRGHSFHSCATSAPAVIPPYLPHYIFRHHFDHR
jgi:hypothetical protein